MLDIKYVRENLEEVKKELAKLDKDFVLKRLKEVEG